MGCLIAVIGLVTPRIAMIFIAIFSNWFQRAFEIALWPILGWIFLPYATLAYMAAMLHNGQLTGGWLALFVIAVLVDIGAIGGSGVKTVRR